MAVLFYPALLRETILAVEISSVLFYDAAPIWSCLCRSFERAVLTTGGNALFRLAFGLGPPLELLLVDFIACAMVLC
jgi:hypothetical protein